MNNSQLKLKNSLLIIAIILATVLVTFISFTMPLTAPIKSLMWLGWLVLVLSLSYFTEQGKLVINFATEAKLEMQKVVWPTRQETIQTTSIVMIMVAITGFLLWLIDIGMMWIIGKITHLG
ncbi:MAG: preprotein translocase subunit SecE [Legionella sp.]